MAFVFCGGEALYDVAVALSFWPPLKSELNDKGEERELSGGAHIGDHAEDFWGEVGCLGNLFDESAGAAEVVLPSDATPDALADALSRLFLDRGRLAEMGRCAAGLARSRAAAEVGDLVVSSAREWEPR